MRLPLYSSDPSWKIFLSYLLITLFFSVLLPVLLAYYPGIPFGVQKDWFGYSPRGYDLSATYQAAANISKGLNPYLHIAEVGEEYIRPGSGADGYNRYSYPPLQAYLLMPLIFFTFEDAYFVWSIVSGVLIVTSLFLLSRMYVSWKFVFATAILIYVQSSFLYFEFERGQTDALVLFFVVLMAFFLKKKRYYFAGMSCAIAALVKVTPVIFLISFLVRKDFKGVLSFVATCLVVVFVTGYEKWYYWVCCAAPYYSGYKVGFGVDHSFSYLMSVLFDGRMSFVVSLSMVSLLLFIFGLLLVLSKDKVESFLLEMAILSIFMNVATPWSANYKLLVLPFVFLSPYAVIEYDWVKKQVALVVWPLFLGFVAIVPWTTLYFLRLIIDVAPLWIFHPDSLASSALELLMQGPHVPSFMDLLFVDRKVAVGLFIVLLTLIVAYGINLFLKNFPCYFKHSFRMAWLRLSRMLSYCFMFMCCFIIFIVVTRPYRAESVVLFETPLDVLAGNLPVSAKISGLGPVELSGDMKYCWGYGPKAIIAFVGIEPAELVLHACFDTPVEGQVMSVVINDQLIKVIDNMSLSADSQPQKIKIPFLVNKGLNFVSFEFSKWNGHGYTVSSEDERPFAARFISLSLAKHSDE